MAGIDVHKDMIKVGIRTPGHRAWTRTSEVLEYRTFFGVLMMAADLRKRGVTHVMEASGGTPSRCTRRPGCPASRGTPRTARAATGRTYPAEKPSNRQVS
ncbi:MAG TPA: hypothetical protein VH163_00420 [Gemmatimonadales bacterium]|nr:hypothetical protein [Gemmatimonadales bacterium]